MAKRAVPSMADPPFGCPPDEQWRPIPGLEFYEASSLGRIRSVDRVQEFDGRWGWTQRRHKGCILRPKLKPNNCGGFYRSFYAGGGETTSWQCNRAVCLAFHGLPPTPLHEAAHLDGDSTNDVASNLIWASPIENASHKKLHGTNAVGSKNAMSRLRESDIKPIFESYCAGNSSKEIASRFNVSSGTVTQVLRGTTWAHVDVGLLRPAASQQAVLNLQKVWKRAAERRRQLGPSLGASS